jgi:catechol 2,3-dioxygenase-like lactoylglutathione lyase family enzyme
MVLGLAHVCFNVSDLNRALEFYSGKLGFKVAFEFHRPTGERYGVYLKTGTRTFIEIFQGTLNARAEKQSYGHICLEVDDVAGTVAELRAKGLELTEPKLGMDQAWQAWLADPDGNRIELHGYTPQSWQTPHLG